MKNMRSLKIDMPPAAELARAADEIENDLRSWDPKDPNQEKIRIVPSFDDEQRRREDIVDDITKQLRAHKRPEQSETLVYNQVVFTCLSVETGKHSPKPADLDEITTELTAAARKLLRVLGNHNLPPNYVFRVFRYISKRNQFIEHLEQLAEITYSKPPEWCDEAQASIPIRHGANFSKNATIWRRFNCRRITTRPSASTP